MAAIAGAGPMDHVVLGHMYGSGSLYMAASQLARNYTIPASIELAVMRSIYSRLHTRNTCLYMLRLARIGAVAMNVKRTRLTADRAAMPTAEYTNSNGGKPTRDIASHCKHYVNCDDRSSTASAWRIGL